MYHYKLYHDTKNENAAKIETGLKIVPYKGASKAAPAVRLTLYAMYDNDFVYHISVYEKEADAIHAMHAYGTSWKEV